MEEISDEEIKLGADSRKVTPVPIPNTVVKLPRADGIANVISERVGQCQVKNSKLSKDKILIELFLFPRTFSSTHIFVWQIGRASCRERV